MATNAPTRAPKVSDSQRKKIEAAIIAALTLVWLARRRSVEAKLGVASSTAIPKAAITKIAEFAADRSTLIQTGVEQYFKSALDALPVDASPSQIATTIRKTATEIDQYNQGILSDYFSGWADQNAQIDTYAEHDAIGNFLWTWTRTSGSELDDECQDAEDMSPAGLDDLMSATGGAPPLHPNCACFLDPYP